MAKTFKKRRNADELDRAAVGVFLRLTENQIKALEQLAGTKPLAVYLRDIAEATIEAMIPAGTKVPPTVEEEG